MRDQATMNGESPDFLIGGGQMGALMRAKDWSETALGPATHWPAALRSVVGLMINSLQPMFVAWGPELNFLYNDGYAPIFGAKHPAALGLPFREVWSEIWSDISPLVDRALAGEAIWFDDLHLVMERNGYPEDTWYSFSYSPVRDDQGDIAGMFCACNETTQRVLADAQLRQSESRLRFFDSLNVATASERDADALLTTTTRMVGEYLGVSICAYADMDEDQDGFTIRDDWSAPGSPSIVGHYRLSDFGTLAVTELGAGRPLIVNDVGRELDPRGATTFAAIGIQATICMPLVKEGQLTALMAVHDRQPRSWTADEIAAVREVTDRSWAHIERVGTEAALRQSEGRLRVLNDDLSHEVRARSLERSRTWEVSPDLLGIATAEGYFDSVNPAWTTTLGWTQEEVAAMPFLDLLHPDDVAATTAELQRLSAGIPVLRFENRYRTKSGDYRWLSWVSVPVDGRFYSSARDVTLQKVTEAERDQLWRLSEDMLARADYGGGLSAVNPAWTHVLGWSEHKLLTDPYADIIHPEDLGLTTEALQTMRVTGKPTRFENRVQASDGTWTCIGWTVSPEADKENFIAVGRDLTDYKARERELAQAQEALRQSQKMEAVGQLTGGIAHDFNNLLQGISGSLEMIERFMAAGREDRVKVYIEAAMTSSRRAAALTQRLLAFARRQTLDPKPTDINRLIDGVEELIRRSVGPHIDIRIDPGERLWLTRIDPSQLENAMLNLSINARDAMPGGGRIAISTANVTLSPDEARLRDLEPGDYVSIAVSDTGTGMSDEVASRAFDPFFTTKPLGQGTGLGLSMVYGFVRQSGGQLRVESVLGEGTTMRFYLPRFDGQIESDAVAETLELQAPGDGQTILIIDDEPAVRLLMVEELRDRGHRILEAGDGPTGLAMLDSEAVIDLLVTDVGLPGGMNGRQVADQARRSRPDLKVLFVTGYAEKAAVGNGLLDPGMEMLVKPFAMDALSRKARDLLDR